MVDASVHHALIEALQHEGYDVVRTPGAGKKDSLDDPTILDISSDEGRVLITTDAHFTVHFEKHLAEGKHHPGVIMGVQSWPAGHLIASVRSTLTTWDSARMQDVLTWARR